MNNVQEATVEELTAIKKLLILGLINSGMTQTQIATALGIDRTTVSRMFPSGALKAASGRGHAA
ncbi:helix-turn-helix domain-containing protein [Maricaulis sp.]|uniref:helix-turn-helix domain-containing protein n=1 Tax=Maricaulis sp. TaxID=1486257 RepID=UPI003A930773